MQIEKFLKVKYADMRGGRTHDTVDPCSADGERKWMSCWGPLSLVLGTETAHRLFLQGRHLVDRRTAGGLGEGIGYLKQALEITPRGMGSSSGTKGTAPAPHRFGSGCLNVELVDHSVIVQVCAKVIVCVASMDTDQRSHGIHFVARNGVAEVEITLQAAMDDHIDRPVARHIHDRVTVDSRPNRIDDNLAYIRRGDIDLIIGGRRRRSIQRFDPFRIAVIAALAQIPVRVERAGRRIGVGSLNPNAPEITSILP